MAGFEADFGVVLAGGQGSRMDFQDKSLIPVAGVPIIERVIRAAKPQVGKLLLSVNRNAENFDYLGLESFPDFTSEHSGPLIGIVSAMRHIRERDKPGQLLACFAADVPAFPADLISRLIESLRVSNADVALASCNGELQPLFSVWKLSLLPLLEAAVAEGCFGPKMVLPRLNSNEVHFDSPDQRLFFNINDASDLKTAQNLFKNG